MAQGLVKYKENVTFYLTNLLITNIDAARKIPTIVIEKCMYNSVLKHLLLILYFPKHRMRLKAYL
jgi:hypothetical protein